MDISSTVKALISLRGMKQGDLQETLNMSSKQAMSNKMAKNSWSAEDIANVATAAGCKLAFILPNGETLNIN